MKFIIGFALFLMAGSAHARTEYLRAYGTGSDRDQHWACDNAERDVRWDLERDCRWEAGADSHWLSMVSYGMCSCHGSGTYWNCDVSGSATCHIND